MVDKNVFIISEEELEKDRNARGYGFEIGRGHPLTTDIETLSEDNPFVDKNWRDKLAEAGSEIAQKDDFEAEQIEQAKTDDPFAGMKRAGERKTY